jgi:hypothetical protein
MKKIKQTLSLLITALIFISLSTSCGSEDKTKDEVKDQVEAPQEEAADISTMQDEEADNSNMEATDDDVASVSDASGSENWDQMLNDYEQYVDEYIKFYKLAMKGDASALSEYPEMMEKATNLSESMQKAQNDNQLSVKQLNRMAKIQTRMLQAATSN